MTNGQVHKSIRIQTSVFTFEQVHIRQTGLHRTNRFTTHEQVHIKLIGSR